MKKYECKVCDKTLIGQKQWDAHCRGKTHIHKQEMSEIESSCTVCNVVFSSKQHRDTHMAGKRHMVRIMRCVLLAVCGVAVDFGIQNLKLIADHIRNQRKQTSRFLQMRFVSPKGGWAAG